jgi:hypothetical protein
MIYGILTRSLVGERKITLFFIGCYKKKEEEEEEEKLQSEKKSSPSKSNKKVTYAPTHANESSICVSVGKCD